MINMKKINIENYSEYMGKLIDVRHPIDYKNEYHHPSSTNIYYEKLIYNHKNYLNKNDKYYITCNKGTLSKKTVSYLEYYGYDVTQVMMK